MSYLSAFFGVVLWVVKSKINVVFEWDNVTQGVFCCTILFLLLQCQHDNFSEKRGKT